jgi:hypothetical protein
MNTKQLIILKLINNKLAELGTTVNTNEKDIVLRIQLLLNDLLTEELK